MRCEMPNEEGGNKLCDLLLLHLTRFVGEANNDPHVIDIPAEIDQLPLVVIIPIVELVTNSLVEIEQKGVREKTTRHQALWQRDLIKTGNIWLWPLRVLSCLLFVR